jgi:predicted phosphohydrolase
MPIWAIADLHLSFGVPDKTMDIFGEKWVRHAEKIQANWLRLISSDDLVLIPGDISWAMRTEEARPDLEWIDKLPGTKVILRGNHDYWWTSLSKVEKILPPSIHLLQNNVFRWNQVSVAGARLWDSSEYSFQEYVEYVPNAAVKNLEEEPRGDEESEKVFQRELLRLELSLKGLLKDDTRRIAMTHYPPIGARLLPSRVSTLLEKYQVSLCVFGHLHNIKQGIPLFGTKNDICYFLTSCDYLNFCPIKIGE